MHRRSRMTIDPGIAAMPERSTSGFHRRPGIHHSVHQERERRVGRGGGVTVVIHGRSLKDRKPSQRYIAATPVLFLRTRPT